jgi:hypothetical protein
VRDCPWRSPSRHTPARNVGIRLRRRCQAYALPRRPGTKRGRVDRVLERKSQNANVVKLWRSRGLGRYPIVCFRLAPQVWVSARRSFNAEGSKSAVALSCRFPVFRLFYQGRPC